MDFLKAANLPHGTSGSTSPPKVSILRIFSPWEIRRLRPVSNPRTWVPPDYRSRYLYLYRCILRVTEFSLCLLVCGPASSVGIATHYGLDSPGIESRWGRYFSHTFRPAFGAHPASCTMGTGCFPGVKRPGRGADHPPPRSAEVENV
jgi:hypothetical protein